MPLGALRRIPLLPIFLLIVSTATRLPAQLAYFALNTDTIAVTGGTTVSLAMTIEAVFIFTDSTSGSLYFEQRDAQEHKQLGVGAASIGGYAYNPSAVTTASVSIAIPLNVPHHVAFVQSSSSGTRRLFLDGSLVYQDSDFSGGISNAVNDQYPTAIGASYFGTSNTFSPSFVGYLDSIRVSDTARYTGSFTAPTGDMTTDGATLLLYNFLTGEVVGGVVQDMSGNGHAGTLGTGFTGATSPTIVTSVPEPAALAPLAGALVLAAAWMRRRGGAGARGVAFKRAWVWARRSFAS